MAEMDDELPSFSLGLDSDSDTDSPPHSCDPAAPLHLDSGSGDDNDFQSANDHPPQTLRRLRRGIHVCPPLSPPPPANIDDDIEEFSSEEEMGALRKPSAQRSNKLPLSRASSLVSTDPCSSRKSVKPTQPSVASTQQASSSKQFQTPASKSPIRKFFLIDSDSDDPLVEEAARNSANVMSSRGKTSASSSKPSSEDLWKDFHPMNSTRIETPAFDEFCSEYFCPSKENKNASRKPEMYSIPCDDVSLPQTRNENNLPPSHQYFFHDDVRIRNLVRSRLPHFFPLGGGNFGDRQHPYTANIDYMSQFNNGEPSQKRGTTQNVAKKKGLRARGKSVASNAEEPMGSDGWVSPRSSVSLPTNAGKRRVHASGKSAGRWYTGPDGRKVYVSGNGQEMTGLAAYRNYKKESGTGYRKSRKKPKANKKAKR